MSRQAKGARSVIVVEAGNEMLKFVQVDRSRGEAEVTSVQLRSFDGRASSLIGGLDDVLGKLKLAKATVVACLPRQAVNVRFIEIPSTDPDEIADMVELQVGTQTPYARDEIIADYRTIGQSPEGYTRIILTIVQRNLMRLRFRLLEEAGLEVASMSISSEGLLNWYRSVGAGKDDASAAIMLDVDASYTDFAVVADGQLVFTKTILIGARQLLDEPGEWRDKFIQEIENSLEIYRGEMGVSAPVKRMFVTGAGVNVDGLDVLLGKHFSMVAKPVDCMHNTKRGRDLPNIRTGKFKHASFTALMGMALAPESLEFSLVPEPVRLRKNLTAKAKDLTSLGTLVMAVLAVASLLCMGMLQEKSFYLAKLNEHLASTVDEALLVEKKKETIRLIQDRLDAKRSTLNVLLELHRVTPANAFYERITIESGGRLELRGKARGLPELDRLTRALAESAIIVGDVPSPRKSRTDDNQISFTVTSEVQEE